LGRYYPIHLDVTGRLCVIVGGGAVAARKALGLLEAGATVRIVSPEVSDAVKALVADGRIEYVSSCYRGDSLDGACLVIAATNAREVNTRVAADARSRNLPVAVADAPSEGTFIVPSVVRRGEFCVTVSTGGSHPALAARLAGELAERFGPEYGAFVELLGAVRDTVKEWTSDRTARRRAAASILNHETELRAHLAAGRREEAQALALAVARQALDAGAEDS
jgi:precorrin-2 dehydrogenase / sirohydrochlorin ferrochelatase